MVDDGDEQPLGELESSWELLLQLPHTVHPLDEDGGAVRVGVTLVAVTYTQLEFVSKRQPLFLDKYFEASERAVVGVQHEHSEGGELSSAIPTV